MVDANIMHPSQCQLDPGSLFYVAMDQRRFENAIALRDAGRVEDALLEFRALAEEASEINEQASLLLNEHTCFCLLDRLEDATRTLNIIHELEVDDPPEYGTQLVDIQRHWQFLWRL